MPLLEVKNLTVEFHIPEGVLKALDGISFMLNEGEVLGIVGESGSGKSTTALSIMNLLPAPSGRIKEGEIFFKGEPLLEKIDELRGKDISMVFQNPLNSLNPSLKIGQQLMEVLQEHMGMSEEKAWDESIATLKMMGIPDPETMMNRYPFEFSGGMRQRAMIAMAMLCRPKLLIADEPTTALDVTIQAQILRIFKRLKKATQTSIIFISHDLSVIAQIADRVLIMYAGKILEISSVRDLFKRPLHPYTQGLLKSIPSFSKEKGKKLYSIPGNVPNLLNPPSGCVFHPRCPYTKEICNLETPPNFKVGNSTVSCWLFKGADVVETT